MSRRHMAIISTIGAAACLCIGLGTRERIAPRLLFNTTASAPLGFYLLTPGRYARGELAAVRPPRELASWLARRGYLPANVPLLKEIAATAGQIVCGQDGRISIDGVPLARMQDRDRRGRPLPQFHGCRVLVAGEVFLLNPRAPASLDSRYFGPVPAEGVIGGARPLWTWSA